HRIGKFVDECIKPCFGFRELLSKKLDGACFVIWVQKAVYSKAVLKQAVTNIEREMSIAGRECESKGRLRAINLLHI
ncbi:hypothetical protein, partial [Flavonifractor plautii]|uniref:hypothetical protein n=1 Tax=Flavonifractor plautii TaxID=292800 RepID=UPI003D7CBE80